MSYFNDDQIANMQYLNSLPAEAKCRCGWNTRGQCYNCKPEDGGKPTGEHAPVTPQTRSDYWQCECGEILHSPTTGIAILACWQCRKQAWRPIAVVRLAQQETP